MTHVRHLSHLYIRNRATKIDPLLYQFLTILIQYRYFTHTRIIKSVNYHFESLLERSNTIYHEIMLLQLYSKAQLQGVVVLQMAFRGPACILCVRFPLELPVIGYNERYKLLGTNQIMVTGSNKQNTPFIIKLHEKKTPRTFFCDVHI